MNPSPAALDADLAVRSYFGDPDWMFKTGLGGVLSAACLLVGLMDVQRFLFVPVGLAFAAVIVGFLLRSARQRLKDPDGRLPEWNEWGDLFFSGLNWIAIQFCLTILAAIPITIIMITSSFLLASYSTNPNAVGVIVGLIFLSVIAIVMGAHLITSYLLLNFAAEEKLLSGFAIVKVLRRIAQAPGRLITAWILSFQLQFFAVLIPTMTILGAFVVPSTLFAAQLVGISLMAQAWRSVEEAEKFTARV